MANLVVHTASLPLGVSDVDLCARVRTFGVALTLVPADRGVVLEGVSPSYYGKQMAQELARQARYVVIANRIQVDRTAGAAVSS